jgi:hypothetical protein
LRIAPPQFEFAIVIKRTKGLYASLGEITTLPKQYSTNPSLLFTRAFSYDTAFIKAHEYHKGI